MGGSDHWAWGRKSGWSPSWLSLVEQDAQHRREGSGGSGQWLSGCSLMARHGRKEGIWQQELVSAGWRACWRRQGDLKAFWLTLFLSPFLCVWGGVKKKEGKRGKEKLSIGESSELCGVSTGLGAAESWCGMLSLVWWTGMEDLTSLSFSLAHPMKITILISRALWTLMRKVRMERWAGQSLLGVRHSLLGHPTWMAAPVL